MRTALEAGVVVATILLLAALALGSYQPLIGRSHTAEAFMLTSTAKTDLLVERAQHGSWPDARADIVIDTYGDREQAGRYVARVDLDDGGALSAWFGDDVLADLRGRRLTQRPATGVAEDGLPVIWLCDDRQPPAGTASQAADFTSVDTRLLPATCRGQ